jgi:hypothetical protein
LTNCHAIFPSLSLDKKTSSFLILVEKKMIWMHDSNKFYYFSPHCSALFLLCELILRLGCRLPHHADVLNAVRSLCCGTLHSVHEPLKSKIV